MDVSGMLGTCTAEGNILDQLLSLDIAHAIDTGDTVTDRNVSDTVSSLHHFSIPPYPTVRTRPVSARPASSCTPRILCSRMDDTSVGAALVSAA